MRIVKAILKELDLELHEQKTRIVDTTQGNDGFEFLGYYNRQIWSAKRKRYYSQKWPSNKSMKSLRIKIKDFLGRRAILPLSITEVVKRLNPILRGWMNYFKFGNSAKKFSSMDMYVHERVALWWSKKHNKSGRRWVVDLTRDKLYSYGVQELSGNVIYWSRYSKA